MTAGDDDSAEARAVALRLLARREHTGRELTAKLVARDVDAALAAAVVAQLIDEGLLSEERFAEAFVRSRIDRGYGPIWLSQEMRRRGVPAELADRALAMADVDWRCWARQVRARRFGDALPQARREVVRQLQFLQRRGFTAEQTRAALGGAVEDDC